MSDSTIDTKKVVAQDEEYTQVVLEDVDGFYRPRKRKPVEKKKTKSTGWEYVAAASQIGFDIALPIATGLFVGAKIDEAWGTRPKVTLLLFVLGLVIACTSLIRIVRDSTSGR